ncbi:MAG: glycosyltransferase family 9 protein [Acidobacteriota bacterium]|nr:glycosyltransferase family 9 protein [Acidobacteriota bacterium]
MAALQIYDRRERALVSAGDAVLGAIAALARLFRRRHRPQAPARMLLLRLERIGDLLMAVPAIGEARAAAPNAEIDLVVGSWNADVARSIRGINKVLIVDAPWLARDAKGAGAAALAGTALGWRARRYDLAVNFEPDVRSNALLALSGARWTAGYRSAGGGALLDQALDYQPQHHTVDNARRLVRSVLGEGHLPGVAGLDIPGEPQRIAEQILGGKTRPLVAMHAAGGREVKQWDPARFAAVARRLIEDRGATLVLTGGPGDAAIVEGVKRALPAANVIDVSNLRDLLSVAAVLERCDLMITGDTGPMHLAGAVGTPIVAVFGPSDPRRYAPRGPLDRVVRIDLPCAPCNRIRLPPDRCTGHIPDCLAFVSVDRVLAAALEVLDEIRIRNMNPPA